MYLVRQSRENRCTDTESCICLPRQPKRAERAAYVRCATMWKASKEVSLPIIGLVKKCYPDSEIYITPTKADVDRLLKVPCDVICMDATLRLRPNGESLEELYRYARQNCGNRGLMADVATVEDAINAEKLGFDYVSTTMRGYTAETKNALLPDFDFMRECKKCLSKAKLIAEGEFSKADT